MINESEQLAVKARNVIGKLPSRWLTGGTFITIGIIAVTLFLLWSVPYHQSVKIRPETVFFDSTSVLKCIIPFQDVGEIDVNSPVLLSCSANGKVISFEGIVERTIVARDSIILTISVKSKESEVLKQHSLSEISIEVSDEAVLKRILKLQ